MKIYLQEGGLFEKGLFVEIFYVWYLHGIWIDLLSLSVLHHI